MIQCKTQADCFRELARVMDMCDGANVQLNDCIRVEGKTYEIDHTAPFFQYPDMWSFAIAIVEDKPVFIGDTIYNAPGSEMKVLRLHEAKNALIGAHQGTAAEYIEYIHACSWNPPAPKKPTEIDIRISVEVAEFYSAKTKCGGGGGAISAIQVSADLQVGYACRKALDEMSSQ